MVNYHEDPLISSYTKVLLSYHIVVIHSEPVKRRECPSASFINPLRPKRHYSGFVINKQYNNYNSCVLWAMKLG